MATIHYRSENGVSGYHEGDILVDDSTGKRSFVVRDGRGLVLTPCPDDDVQARLAKLGGHGWSEGTTCRSSVRYDE